MRGLAGSTKLDIRPLSENRLCFWFTDLVLILVIDVNILIQLFSGNVVKLVVLSTGQSFPSNRYRLYKPRIFVSTFLRSLLDKLDTLSLTIFLGKEKDRAWSDALFVNGRTQRRVLSYARCATHWFCQKTPRGETWQDVLADGRRLAQSTISRGQCRASLHCYVLFYFFLRDRTAISGKICSFWWYRRLSAYARALTIEAVHFNS